MIKQTDDPSHGVAALRAALGRAVAALGEPPAQPSLDRPRNPEHGDYSTNAAMLLAKPLGMPPRDVAASLAGLVEQELGPWLERVEIAGPGFLNLFLADSFLRDALAAFDPSPRRRNGQRVNIEFVSANPTGPVHIGHARNAAYGDALASILAFGGYDVTREYYVNDAGSQVANLARSIRARARGEEVAEDGYLGDYVAEVAAEIPGAAELPLDELQPLGIEAMLRRIRESLEVFGVRFDVWFSEAGLHRGSPSPVEQAIGLLSVENRIFELEDALWLRTSDLGDDKDRVLRRSDGEYTYFASDIAYHQDKRERGYDHLVDVLGADHHGYVARMKAAYEALGGDRSQLELAIMQFVNLVSGGERVSMSKRAGSFETLDDLIAAVGVDAGRWFLINRSHDTTIEFDLDLAARESAENPVYYVQYAHARIASVLRRAGEGVPAAAAGIGGLALHPSERDLIHKLLAFGDEIAEAGERRAVHRVPGYALELAQTFTAFYRDCQILGAEPAGAEAFRLALADATRRALAQCLDLVGIGAPDEM